MNILHVCGSFPPAYAYGGPARSTYELSSALVERGHDVTVYTTDAKDAKQRADRNPNPEVLDGIEVHRFRNISNKLSWKNVPLAPKMGIEIFRDVSEFDVVHSHEFRSAHTVFAHWGSKRHDVPHVLQPRGSLPRHSKLHSGGSYTYAGKNKLKSVFDRVLGNEIVRDASRIVASSHIESDQYNHVNVNVDLDLVCHLPNGISSADFQELPARGTFRADHDIAEDEYVVLFLGRLHPQKGGDLLLEAIGDSGSYEKDVSLVFAGPDEGDLARLERMAERYDLADRTYFPGPLYGEEKKSAYVDADVFVLPSHYESFGNVVIEAMSCGTPVVATDVCGVAGWVNHKGFQTVAQSPTEIAFAVRRSMERQYSNADIRSYALQNFTWREVASRAEEIYDEVTA